MTARALGDLCAAGRRAAEAPLCLDARFGGLPLRLRFHDADLAARMGPAFDPGDGAEPALTVDAWAGPFPPLPEPAGRRVDPDGCFAAWETHWVFGFDPADRRGFFQLPAGAPLPAWSLAHPMLKLLHAWLRGRGVQVVHGAVVGAGGRGLLIVGRGGAGKSTLAVRGALAGLDYLGDDYVGLRHADRRAFGLYRGAKLEPTHLEARVPAARALRLPAVEGLPKRLLRLPLTPLPAGLPIVGLVLPEVDGGAPRPEPVGPGRALRALAPSTLLQLPGFDEDFGVLAELVRALPAWRLPLGPDLDGAVTALAALCAGA